MHQQQKRNQLHNDNKNAYPDTTFKIHSNKIHSPQIISKHDKKKSNDDIINKQKNFKHLPFQSHNFFKKSNKKIYRKTESKHKNHDSIISHTNNQRNKILSS
jgi:hypothetical protein